ncbi:MAG: gamma-glutamylcyclotransferase [Gemmatimonadetes bacterium]|nr:gamma-glutamylcyclotransferase [Gemmatimonadota bacterium]
MARRADTHTAGARSGCSIALFVYGTLKRGYSNHDDYCRGVLAVEEALVRGCLYIRPDRIPFLEVPDENILATGTADPAADAVTQERLARDIEPRLLTENPVVPPVSGRGVVRGELLEFDDPETRLPAIDRLEGFHPGGRSLYRRVLVPVRVKESFTVAWTYVVETKPHDWPKLKSDCWTG